VEYSVELCSLIAVLIDVSYRGWLAGCQLTLDTSKTAAALMSQRLIALGYSKNDVTFHWLMYVFTRNSIGLEYLTCQMNLYSPLMVGR